MTNAKICGGRSASDDLDYESSRKSQIMRSPFTLRTDGQSNRECPLSISISVYSRSLDVLKPERATLIKAEDSPLFLYFFPSQKMCVREERTSGLEKILRALHWILGRTTLPTSPSSHKPTDSARGAPSAGKKAAAAAVAVTN